MQVQLYEVGWITAAAGIWREGDDFDRQIRFPIPAFVIETGQDRVLVDTGLHPAAVENAPLHYREPGALSRFGLEQERSIGAQIDLEEITKVVLTHLHFDHAGGLSLLPPSVPVFVQRREWEGAHEAAAIARNFYLPVDYVTVERQLKLIDGDHDLLGDGSIRLLLTPGTRRVISLSELVSGL